MKLRGFFLFLLLCALPAGAHHFPICMYVVNQPEELPPLKQAGFNCIQTYNKTPEKLTALASAARQNEMQVVFYPDEIINTTYQTEAQSWPVLAWYLIDEPDVRLLNREKIIDKHNKTKAAFPKHETSLVIGQGRTLIAYYDIPDNLMVDWYPVPHLALTSLGDNVLWAKQGQEKGGKAANPLWAVVQAFDWKEYKQHRPDNDRIGRFPTENELRFMSYDAIINGAEGLFYFRFYTNAGLLPQAHPDWWERLATVTKEIAQLRPVLENGTVTENILSFEPPLAAQTRVYKRDAYTILINRSDKEVAVPSKLSKRKYKLLFGQKKTGTMNPYGVWVIKNRK